MVKQTFRSTCLPAWIAEKTSGLCLKADNFSPATWCMASSKVFLNRTLPTKGTELRPCFDALSAVQYLSHRVLLATNKWAMPWLTIGRGPLLPQLQSLPLTWASPLLKGKTSANPPSPLIHIVAHRPSLPWLSMLKPSLAYKLFQLWVVYSSTLHLNLLSITSQNDTESSRGKVTCSTSLWAGASTPMSRNL